MRVLCITLLIIFNVNFSFSQIDSIIHFKDDLSGKLDYIFETIKVEDGIIISGETFSQGIEHPLLMKIDFNGKLIWSTYDSIQNGTLNNILGGFKIKIFADGFIYGFPQENFSSNNKIWKVNATSGEIAYINNFFDFDIDDLSYCDYDNSKFLITYNGTYGVSPGIGTVAKIAFINKMNGDTIQTFNQGTGYFTQGIGIDSQKNIYYWKDSILTKYNKDMINFPIWKKSYKLYGYNKLHSIQNMHIDYQDNIFLFGKDESFGNNVNGGVVTKVSNQNGQQLWTTTTSFSNGIKVTSLIDRNNFLFISYEHIYVGAGGSGYLLAKVNKSSGITEWFEGNTVTPLSGTSGTLNNWSGSLSIDIDCNGDIYSTGYFADVDYGPNIWANIKVNGTNGDKIYDKIVDLNYSTYDDFSSGVGSFIDSNQSIVLGNLQRLAPANDTFSSGYFTKYDAFGNVENMDQILSAIMLPSHVVDMIRQSDTLFILKQKGKTLNLEAYLNGTSLIWSKSIQGFSNKIAKDGLMKLYSNKLVLVYKENLSSSFYPYDQGVSNRIVFLSVNPQTGITTSSMNYTLSNESCDLLELELDNLSAYLHFEKSNTPFILKWQIGISLSSALSLDLASSRTTFFASQNCMTSLDANFILAVDNLQIKKIHKSTLVTTSLFNFPTMREYNDLYIKNNLCYLVGKDNSGEQLFTIYDLYGDSLIADSIFSSGNLSQIKELDNYHILISGEDQDQNLKSILFNTNSRNIIWENTNNFGTLDNKKLASSVVNNYKNVIVHTGYISRPDSTSDLFVYVTNFYGDSLFSEIIEDNGNSKSFGYTICVSPDSSTLVGGRHNLHFSTNDGVLLSLNVSYCDRIITGQSSLCSGQSEPFLASSGSSYQWTLNGQIITDSTEIHFYPNQSGMYNCIFTDLCGTDTALTNIVFDTISNQASIVSIVANQTSICPSDSTSLSSINAQTFNWYLNNQIIPGQNLANLTVNSPGDYFLIGQDSLGCIDTSQVVTISEFPLINIAFDIQDSILCNNNLPININASPTGGILSGLGVIGNTFDPSNFSQGNYTITYSCLDSNQCSISDSTQIIVNETNTQNLNVSGTDSIQVNGITYYSSGTYQQILSNSSGCDSTLNLIVSLNYSSLSEITKNAEAIIYPNPSTNGIFTFEVSNLEIQNFEIRDIDGRVILSSQHIEIKNKIDLSIHSKGIYFLYYGSSLIKLINN